MPKDTRPIPPPPPKKPRRRHWKYAPVLSEQASLDTTPVPLWAADPERYEHFQRLAARMTRISPPTVEQVVAQAKNPAAMKRKVTKQLFIISEVGATSKRLDYKRYNGPEDDTVPPAIKANRDRLNKERA